MRKKEERENKVCGRSGRECKSAAQGSAAPASPTLPTLTPSSAPGQPLQVREAALGSDAGVWGSLALEGRWHSPHHRLQKLWLASPEGEAACPEGGGWPPAGLCGGDLSCWEHPWRPLTRLAHQKDPERCSDSQSGVPLDPTPAPASNVSISSPGLPQTS